MSRPDIVLYTANTMNGWKPLIFLHEAEIDYELVNVDFSKKEQHAPDYVKMNPNGKIPTIWDRAEGRAIFERGDQERPFSLAELADAYFGHLQAARDGGMSGVHGVGEGRSAMAILGEGIGAGVESRHEGRRIPLQGGEYQRLVDPSSS